MMVLSIISCKSTKVASDGTLDDKLSAKAVIREHYQNELQFRTISGRLKIQYSNGESSQGVAVSLRMEKDRAIWISAPLGMVKAYITPGRVSFYNKLQNEYFDGDFTYLSNLLGTELDFEQVQNLLLGQAIFDLRGERYGIAVADSKYRLKPKKAAELIKILFELEPKNFKMATQQLAEPLKKRLLQINYKNYQKIHKWILPNEIAIAAIEGDSRTTIDIEYKNIEFDQELKFPYRIPRGYQEIVLKNNDL